MPNSRPISIRTINSTAGISKKRIRSLIIKPLGRRIKEKLSFHSKQRGLEVLLFKTPQEELLFEMAGACEMERN